MTLTHHDELEGLTRAMKKLSKHCETSTNSRERIYKMYSNSQASLKVIKKMRSTSNQTRLRRTQCAYEAIRRCDATLELH